ncbi:stage II sporulation protein P [Ammonifex thiophilus]|uniref:stage II sporulation protein P n=1 Tax=Ammonifex thiophilus TaxID=444093 RepID=UPI00140333BF|nr:stage II sporulation protein P [Ammonifex thiophilus]
MFRKGLYLLVLTCLFGLPLAGFFLAVQKGWLTYRQCLVSCLPYVREPGLSPSLHLVWERKNWLRLVLPLGEETVLAVAAPAPSPPPKKEDGRPRPLIIIYNTHTGEAYAPTEGVARVEGGRGGVVKVAAVLAQELEQRGFRVLRSDKIHDTCYATSYLESEKTVKELLVAHPEAVAVFDIHRDSRQPQNARVLEIKGQAVAHVLIVVGSGERQPFPTWEQNLAFARRVAAKADAMYPGLCRGVRVKGGRYNQHLHPRALLFEIGGVDNTLEEAERAAVLWAEVLAAALAEELSP